MQSGSSLLAAAVLLVASGDAAMAGGPRGPRPVERPPSVSPPTRTELARSVNSNRFHQAARDAIFFRSEIMAAQVQRGERPSASLVPIGPHVDMAPALPRGGRRSAGSQYRVSYLRGGTLQLSALLPRRGDQRAFSLRVRHPDGAVQALPAVPAAGPVTVAPLSLRLQRGTTVLEIDGRERIEIHWDGRDRLP